VNAKNLKESDLRSNELTCLKESEICALRLASSFSEDSFSSSSFSEDSFSLSPSFSEVSFSLSPSFSEVSFSLSPSLSDCSFSSLSDCSFSSSSGNSSWGGEFVASHSSVKTSESAESKGSLAAGILAEDKNSSSIPGSFVPPAGFVADSSDLMKPAIWNKSEYSRTIRLDD
jgi:cell division protein FtsZ